MPEFVENLHVVGVTTDGKAWHTLRRTNAWNQFVQIPISPPPNQDPVVDVACFRRLPLNELDAEAIRPTPQGLWVLVAFRDGPPQLLFRDSDTAVWTSIPTALPTATGVALTVSEGVAPDGSNRGHVYLAAVSKNAGPGAGKIMVGIADNHSPGPMIGTISDIAIDGAGDLGPAHSIALAWERRIVLPFGVESR